VDHITTIAEMLSEEIEQELADEHSLTDIEQVARRLLQETGRQAIAMVVNSKEQPYPEPEVPCARCGQGMPYVRRRSAQLRTRFGQVEVERAYYLCSSCHQGCFPLDRRLGLRPNGISAELERLAGMTGTLLPFGKGRDLFEELTLVSLSDHTLDKATQAYGTAAMQREQEWLTAAYDDEELQRRKREVRRPARLYGAVDATKGPHSGS